MKINKLIQEPVITSKTIQKTSGNEINSDKVQFSTGGIDGTIANIDTLKKLSTNRTEELKKVMEPDRPVCENTSLWDNYVENSMMFASLFSNTPIDVKTLSIAHRGGAEFRPENTIASFQNAIKLRSDYVELDVHLSKDGYPVVIHDSTLERTTDGTGNVKDKTLDELKKLDCGSWFSEEFRGEKIPTLEEVLDLAKGRTGVVIEIKNDKDLQDGIEDKIIKTVREKDMVKDVIIISFNKDRIKKINDLDGTIDTGLLYGGNIPDICEMALATGIDYICPYWKNVNEDIIEKAHSCDLKVNIWTVNEASLMKKFTEMGVDGIITDRPDLLLEEHENSSTQ
jgi:glycerophosphoryl diester phosphodiesterase